MIKSGIPYSIMGEILLFYLDFAPKDKLKVSYAASMATSKIAPGFENFVYSMVKRLDYIGVRERSAAEILNKLDITNVHVVCDPVFFIDHATMEKLYKCE